MNEWRPGRSGEQSKVTVIAARQESSLHSPGYPAPLPLREPGALGRDCGEHTTSPRHLMSAYNVSTLQNTPPPLRER